MSIVRIKHKGLRDLFETGRSAKVARDLWENAILILDHLDGIALFPKDCVGVKDFHPLSGDRKGQYSMHVSGNWCVTFTVDHPVDVIILDLEDYH